MRDHEVPTHVQTQDKALLFLTFPQVAALLAVLGMAYGVWRFMSFGPSELRLGLAGVVVLLGVAATLGQIGGRRLPLVAADLLKYRLMPRRYEGPTGELVRSAPPASPDSSGRPTLVERLPSPLTMFARGLKRRMRGRKTTEHKEKKKMKGERNKRRAFRPHMWFRKRRRHAAMSEKARKGRHAMLAVAALLVALTAMAAPIRSASADGHTEEEWPWLEGVEFRPPEQVPGRRLYIEALTATRGRAEVLLRAATDLKHLRVRAYGGLDGGRTLFFGTASLDEGETIGYSLPLDGDNPSLGFSWEDSLGQAGTVTLTSEQLPHPLPSVEGRLCSLTVESVRWRPGTLDGVIASECASTIEEPFDVQTSSGHHSQTVTLLAEASVTAITGTVTVAAGSAQISVPFVADGDTRFSVPVTGEPDVHGLTLTAYLTASIEAEQPPLVQLTHHPEWTQRRTEWVSFTVPKRSKTVSQTVEVTHADGTTTQHVVEVTVSFPRETLSREYTFEVFHPEHVRAEVVERDPMTRDVTEDVSMWLAIGSDAPYRTLVLPEPEEPNRAVHRPLTPDEFAELFGWEYHLWR